MVDFTRSSVARSIGVSRYTCFILIMIVTAQTTTATIPKSAIYAILSLHQFSSVPTGPTLTPSTITSRPTISSKSSNPLSAFLLHLRFGLGWILCAFTSYNYLLTELLCCWLYSDDSATADVRLSVWSSGVRVVVDQMTATVRLHSSHYVTIVCSGPSHQPRPLFFFQVTLWKISVYRLEFSIRHTGHALCLGCLRVCQRWHGGSGQQARGLSHKTSCSAASCRGRLRCERLCSDLSVGDNTCFDRIKCCWATLLYTVYELYTDAIDLSR